MTTVRLIIGTKKGGFIYTSDAKRETWKLSDPILPGWSVYNGVADLRDGQPRLLPCREPLRLRALRREEH